VSAEERIYFAERNIWTELYNCSRQCSKSLLSQCNSNNCTLKDELWNKPSSNLFRQ